MQQDACMDCACHLFVRADVVSTPLLPHSPTWTNEMQKQLEQADQLVREALTALRRAPQA